MKKTLFFLIVMFVFFIIMAGCQNSTEDKTENKLEKTIENSTKIQMNYGVNSYTAIITDQEEIKELEDLFNGAEFYTTHKSTYKQQLHITFHRKTGITRFYIDNNDVIRLGDGTPLKSEEINFRKLVSIYNEIMSNTSEDEAESTSEEKVKVSLDEKLENTKKIAMHRSSYSSFAIITDQEEIKELEDLFNGAEFYTTDEPGFKLGLRITFSGEKGTTQFYINEQDFIKLPDGSYVKSEKITFEKLFAICQEVLLRK